jgi:hypothetical protein
MLEARSSTTSRSSEFEDICPPPDNEEDINLDLATTIVPKGIISDGKKLNYQLTDRYSIDYAVTERSDRIPLPLNSSSVFEMMDNHEEGQRAAGPLSIRTKPSILNSNRMFEEFMIVTIRPGGKPEICH